MNKDLGSRPLCGLCAFVEKHLELSHLQSPLRGRVPLPQTIQQRLNQQIQKDFWRKDKKNELSI